MIIKRIEVAGKLVAVVYSYGPEGGPGYAALVTFNRPEPAMVTQLGEFADAAAANACVTAVAAQMRSLTRADSVRISDSHGASEACNPGHQEATAERVCASVAAAHTGVAAIKRRDFLNKA